jgi:hypothetical protein
MGMAMHEYSRETALASVGALAAVSTAIGAAIIESTPLLLTASVIALASTISKLRHQLRHDKFSGDNASALGPNKDPEQMLRA